MKWNSNNFVELVYAKHTHTHKHTEKQTVAGWFRFHHKRIKPNTEKKCVIDFLMNIYLFLFINRLSFYMFNHLNEWFWQTITTPSIVIIIVYFCRCRWCFFCILFLYAISIYLCVVEQKFCIFWIYIQNHKEWLSHENWVNKHCFSLM